MAKIDKEKLIMEIGLDGVDGGDEEVPRKEYTPWPWHEESESWMGIVSYDRRQEIISSLRAVYGPGPNPPLFPTEEEWRIAVRSDAIVRYGAEAELAVEILTSIICRERTPLRNGDDPSFIASSIRKQRGEHACRGMYDSLKDTLSMLDGEPSLEDLRAIYQTHPGGDLAHAPRSKLVRHFALSGYSTGGRPFTKLDRHLRAYRASVDLWAPVVMASMGAAKFKLGPPIDETTELGSRLTKDASEKGNTLKDVINETDTPEHRDDVHLHGPQKNMQRTPSQKQMKVMKQQPEQISDKDRMKQYKLVERHIRDICQEDELCADLWIRIDLNGNRELGLSECHSYLSNNYPILAGASLRRAFHDAAAVAADEPEGHDGTMEEHDAGKVIVPRGFRKFLYLTLYYAQCLISFNLMDWNTDHYISRDEFDNGKKTMRKFLKAPELTFEDICVEGKDQFSFRDLCLWMKKHQQSLLAELEHIDTHLERRESMAVTLIPRMLDFDSFSDLVLHCHYVNRNAPAQN